MIFRPRKSLTRLLVELGLVELQWSRDLSTTEIASTKAPIDAAIELQWSRDLSTTEIWSKETLTIQRETLQWSRDLSTTEIAGDRRSGLRNRYRFNGAVIFRPRKYDGDLVLETTLNSFNGAVIFRPRKFAEHVAKKDPALQLQWSRDLSTTEISPTRLNVRSLRRRFNGAVIFRPRKFKVPGLPRC